MSCARDLPSSSNPVAPSLEENRDTSVHQSVLLHEAVEALAVQPSDIVVDGTLGGAGHAQLIAQKLGKAGVFIGFDLDADAIRRAEATLKGSVCRTVLINSNFRHLQRELAQRGIERIDKALFDLGWSSDQLTAGRGFSFLSDEPLIMTFGAAQAANGLTAAIIVNEWEESSLADVIYGWGEERYARRIARAIVDARTTRPIQTSKQLAELIKHVVPPKYAHGRLHPATRTFQALRIAVNDELGALQEALHDGVELLTPGGRIAVITFHSIEDRIVKHRFQEFERDGMGQRVTKKPLSPSPAEIMRNPRSRSAKLRVFQKL